MEENTEKLNNLLKTSSEQGWATIGTSNEENNSIADGTVINEDGSVTETISISLEEAQAMVEEIEKKDSQESTPDQKIALTAEQRIEILQEISVLQQLINTTYHMPKFDKGNGGKQAPKVTGSVPMNFFKSEELNEWANKIVQLTKLL